MTWNLRRAMRTPGLSSVRAPGMPSPVMLRGLSSDAATFVQIFLRGDLDFEVPGDPRTIIDAGANIGLASIYLTQRYPKARIIAVEFEEANFKQLLRNTASYPNIECVHAGLWPTDGRVAVANPEAQKWAHFPSEVAGDAPAEHSVRAISMPTLLAERGVAHVDLLKIDIEGSEYELFDAVPDWLRRVSTIAIELHDHLRPGAGERFLASLHERRPLVRCKGEYLVCTLNPQLAVA